MVQPDDLVSSGEVIARWDPRKVPIVAEVGGKVRFDEIVEGSTLRTEKERATGTKRLVIMEHKELHPQVLLDDERGHIKTIYFLPDKSNLEVREGMEVMPGDLLARTPIEEEAGFGGYPRLCAIFYARRPRDPAILAEVTGFIELGEKKKGKRLIRISPVGLNGKRIPNYEPLVHKVPAGKHLRVRSADRVKSGDPLVSGAVSPYDILRILGVEELRQHLVQEVQTAFRTQNLKIDDKHIEIIVAQMLRKVKVEAPGDSELLPGTLIDKFAFRDRNEQLMKSVKVKDAGDSGFKKDQIVSREEFEKVCVRLKATGKRVPRSEKPLAATCSVQLLSISKVFRLDNSSSPVGRK
jgi:DNA-directed RNA polymerase subunit beta'